MFYLPILCLGGVADTTQHLRSKKNIFPLDCQLIDTTAAHNMGVKLPGLRISQLL